MTTILSFLQCANDYGLWDALQFLILVVTFIYGLRLIFFPRRRIRNLNFHTQLLRNRHPSFSLAVSLELRNYTGRTVVISSPFTGIPIFVRHPKRMVIPPLVNMRSSFLILVILS